MVKDCCHAFISKEFILLEVVFVGAVLVICARILELYATTKILRHNTPAYYQLVCDLHKACMTAPFGLDSA